MKLFLSLLFLTLQASAVEPPQTYMVSRYNHLWQNSPITDPPPEIAPDVKNDLDDWVLVGLEKYADSNYVTLLNKKDTKQRIRVPGPDPLAKEFSILEVKRGSGSMLETEVVLKKGIHRGTVAFDAKYLTIRKAPAPRPNKKAPKPTPVSNQVPGKGVPPGLPATAGQGKAAGKQKKAPRTRYIPKPKPKTK